MNTRLQQFLDAEGLSPTRFADAIGVQRSNVSHVLSGRNNPGYDFLVKMLLRYPAINPEWLMLGKGSMYKEAHMPSLFTDKELEKATVSIDNPIEPETPQKPVISLPKQDTVPTAPAKADRQLTRVLFCYSDGSFELFDR